MLASKRQRAAVSVAFAALVLTAAGCSSSSSSVSSGGGALTTIKVLEYPTSGYSWLPYIAQHEGYFKQQGITMQEVAVAQGVQATSALIAGSVDIAGLAPANVSGPLSQGQKLDFLVNGYTENWVLTGKKSFAGESLQDVVTQMEGGSVATPSVGGVGEVLFTAILAAYGIAPSKVKVAADVQGASVLSGSVDAGVYNPPVTCSLNAQGLPNVFNFATSLNGTTTYPAALEALKGIPGFGYYSQSSWASAHPKLVTGFQTAIREAANWAVQPQNASAVAALMRKSEYNVSTLSNSQWLACSKGVTAAFSTNFSMSDVATWNTILKESNLGFSSLPAGSGWIDKGALTS